MNQEDADLRGGIYKQREKKRKTGENERPGLI